jgi:hypothetical protein
MALLAGAAAATLPRPALAVGTGPDATLIALAAEIMAVEAESDRLKRQQDEIPDFRAAHLFSEKHIRSPTNRAPDLMTALATMQATTMAGFCAKARIIQRFNNCAPDYADPRAG